MAAVAAMAVVVAMVVGWSFLGGSDALVNDGANGQFGFPNAKVGGVFWFALPSFDNATDTPVHLVSVTLKDPPSSVRVLGYRGQSARARGGVLLGYRPDSPPRDDPRKFPDVPVSSIVVPPHGRADAYVMVELRLTSAARVELTQTSVTYTVSGRTRTQILSMDLIIEGVAASQSPD